MTISYEGTNYVGWQVQPNGLSIQQLIQEKLGIILKEPMGVTGSGRTDAGVHALGQVAHFHTSQELDLYKTEGSLNGLLPKDIRILAIEATDPAFHARYSATGKEYHYHLWLDKVQSPFRRNYSLHVRQKIDLELLNEASRLFLGTHDFTAFTNESHRGCAAHDPVRTIKRIELVVQEGGVHLEFEGDGFLYKMVRNIVGTLLEVAKGKRSIDSIPLLFESRDRRAVGMTAPPQGLFLVKVFY